MAQTERTLVTLFTVTIEQSKPVEGTRGKKTYILTVEEPSTWAQPKRLIAEVEAAYDVREKLEEFTRALMTISEYEEA